MLQILQVWKIFDYFSSLNKQNMAICTMHEYISVTIYIVILTALKHINTNNNSYKVDIIWLQETSSDFRT